MATSDPTTESTRATVLVAEDNPSNYKLTEVILRKTYNLLHAENGAEAIELYRLHRPDVVLMDINMPIMDGYDALKGIRSEFPNARVIALTAYAFETDRQHMIQAGFDHCLSKPLRIDELRQTIKETLECE
ncbi:MAG: response regulator [Alistipes sp.]